VEHLAVQMGIYSVVLTPQNAERTLWTGTMTHEDFQSLDDGILTFTFTARWNNGTQKVVQPEVLISGNWSDYFRIHRKQ
jgi:hypothetical protein